MLRKPIPVEERFWRFVVKHDDCWEWAGAKHYGYGIINISRKAGTTEAHRLSWEIHNGAIPDGMCVCHKCDNRACVNPLHLFLGDRNDNNQDMWSKGRGSKPPRHGILPPRHVGVAHHNAKLVPTQIQQIRELANQGLSGRFLASVFKVSPTTISNILQRKIWKEVA